MIKIKLSHPLRWQREDLPSNYLGQSPDKKGIWQDYKFEINNTCDTCDYWIIHGDINGKYEKSHSKQGVIFITAEEKSVRTYNAKHLAQFNTIITSRDDIQHPNVIRTQYICPWQIHKSFDELIDSKATKKTKNLSAIISDMTHFEGHKKRYAFTNLLKGHFKEKLDWFGRGNLFIENKWDGLADYRYSLAIENSQHLHYFTEKITDCFLAYTMPIYWGCSNILDYFPEKSMILVDINNFEEAIKKIEQAIEENWYQKNFDAIIEARNLILHKYQFMPKIIDIIENKQNSFIKNNKTQTIFPEQKYTHLSIVKRVKRKVLSQFKKSHDTDAQKK